MSKHYHCRACLSRTGEEEDSGLNELRKFRCIHCGYVWFRNPPRPRDSQRSRVYKAENAVFSRANPLSFEQIRRAVAHVYYDPRFTAVVKPKQRSAPNARFELPQLTLGSKRSGASAGRWRIRFSPSSRLHWIAVHELSHIGVYLRESKDPGHGPEFCAIYLELVRAFCGAKPAELLARSFIAHRVRFSPPAP